MTAPKPIVRARMRYKRCQDISNCARFIGLDVTPASVNTKFEIWDRWFRGTITTGYAMHITGTQAIRSRAC